MPGQHLGDSFWIEATIVDKEGKAINPDSHVIRLLDPRGTERDKETNPNFISTGRFEAELTIPMTGSTGLWKVEWCVIANSKQETEILNFVVHST